MNLATATGMTAEEWRLSVGGRRHARARVAYLVSKYSAPSHTFIRREIDALRRRGVIVDTFSIRRPTQEELQSVTDRREYANTWRLPELCVLRELAGADLFVLASFMEGLPVVLMEALGLRVPVIAPRVAGIPELVEHGETGLLFSPANWDELTEHMMTLVKDGSLRDKLADAGRARGEAGFDITRAVEPLYHRFMTRADESSRARR